MAAGLRLLSWIFYNSKGACYSPSLSKVVKQFREDRSSDLKVIDIKKFKMAAILQPPSWILKNEQCG
jgi:hypothetical protein